MILVDTDVLIAHLRGYEEARDWLRSAHAVGQLSVSVVTVAEILGGMRSTEKREVQALLAVLRSIPVTDAIARTAGELGRTHRRSHSSIGLPDLLIAATADHHGLALATLNVKHFPMIENLRAPFTLRPSR